MRFSKPIQATEWRPKPAHGETVGFNFKMNKAPGGAKEKIRGWFFCRPVRGGKFFCDILPTVSPWATLCRVSGAIFAALVLFFAVGAAAETTNTLSDAEIQGCKLAQQLCEVKPGNNLSQSGTLKIREASGRTVIETIQIAIQTFPTGWQTKYESEKGASKTNITILKIIHMSRAASNGDQPVYVPIYSFGEYNLDENKFQLPSEVSINLQNVTGEELFQSFANSDFWLCDLGLEFFHWPQQKILPKPTTVKRGRDYTLLESTCPNPPTNGYSRVVSWIDKETGGILEADAYDANGKLLKEFEPKSFKKINGQWELQEMEIRNVQTGSRTRLEFDLKH
jgi:Outer membrane lipoprotein-sorting protein